MARLIDADSIFNDFLKRCAEMERDRKLCFFAARGIKQDFADMISNATTVDAVPVSELEKLRDYLYAELNKLIANYGAKIDEVSE